MNSTFSQANKFAASYFENSKIESPKLYPLLLMQRKGFLKDFLPKKVHIEMFKIQRPLKKLLFQKNINNSFKDQIKSEI